MQKKKPKEPVIPTHRIISESSVVRVRGHADIVRDEIPAIRKNRTYSIFVISALLVIISIILLIISIIFRWKIL